MTVTGLCVFLDINTHTWSDWKKSRPDLKEVQARVEAIIDAQKFEGASAGLLSAQIIARELGLIEKSEQQSSVVVEIKGTDTEL
jgi:DNA-packaging protein gp3